ncbi:MAG: ribulose-phosphate 3-epimerase [Firmicutes bacterium]|nr:ribulose-phosphate 3-epimerase [Bacillota bacterium]
MQLAPSILSADFSKLEEDVKAIERGGAHLIHVDVMDGHFVPNISFGASVMKSLLGKTDVPFDVHLMIEDPDKYLEDFLTPNTEYITVHQEACVHLHRTIQHIKDKGVKAGVSLNPATPLETLDYILQDVDMVLLMSVNPGFGGQSLIPQVLDKVRELARIKKERNLDFLIEIDGGVKLDNVKEVVDAGVEIVVAGSAVFKADDIEARTKEFVRLIGEA